MNFNKAFKHKIINFFSKFDFPLIINSYGRSGSTVLCDSIIKSSLNDNYKMLSDFYYTSPRTAWNLNNFDLCNGLVYKTHDYPPVNLKYSTPPKFIYTYSNPIDVVFSLIKLKGTKGDLWIKNHFENLKAPFVNDFNDVIRDDIFYLEKHLDSWVNQKEYSVCFVKYEEMWNHQKEISEYLGFEIKLPEFKSRSKKEINFKFQKEIKKSYHTLIEKHKSYENLFFIN